jgi:hypothetical protein
MIEPKVTLSRALVDPDMLGNVFSAESFWTWRVVAKLLDGIALTEPREIELYQQCTGRTKLPTGPIRRWIILVGRRGGKDRFMSAVAVWRAALALDWRKHISAGEGAVCLLLGADRKQGGILRNYCDGLLRTPLFGFGHKPAALMKQVARSTDDLIDFKNGSTLEIVTNNASLIRGRSAIAVLGTECAHWKVDEHSSSSDEEVVGAAEPSMAMSPAGELLILASSVHRKRGYMYRQFKRLFGNDDIDDTLCWFAPSATMNPVLPERVVTRALADNAPKARAEYQNIWREDVDDFLPLDVIEAATDWGRTESPPQRGVQYYAFSDAATGTGKDSFALAIAHAENTGGNAPPTIVVDLIRERKPRFVASDVIAEYAALMRSYGIGSVMSDNFGAGLVGDEWARNETRWSKCPRITAENYLRVLPMLTSPGRVHLPDSATLRAQLSGLERHVVSGHETVKHGSSAHDDLAAAVAGVAVLVASAARRGGALAVGVETFGSRGGAGGMVIGDKYVVTKRPHISASSPGYAEPERAPPPADLRYIEDDDGNWVLPYVDPRSR